jgi:hypothetical protein
MSKHTTFRAAMKAALMENSDDPVTHLTKRSMRRKPNTSEEQHT